MLRLSASSSTVKSPLKLLVCVLKVKLSECVSSKVAYPGQFSILSVILVVSLGMIEPSGRSMSASTTHMLMLKKAKLLFTFMGRVRILHSTLGRFPMGQVRLSSETLNSASAGIDYSFTTALSASTSEILVSLDWIHKSGLSFFITLMNPPA